MRNRRNMKRGSTKNASTNDWEGVPSAVRTWTGGSIGRTEFNKEESWVIWKEAPVSRSHRDVPGEGDN
jgi:hypothetical protein